MSIKKILVCLLFSLISCKDSKKNETKTEANEVVPIVSQTKIVNSLGETLNTESKKLIEDWPEYIILDQTITEYYSISSDEALLKAKDLSLYTQQLKDSIRNEIFDRPDMKIRMNVLYNNTLRLADMETIKNIKPEEVKTEVTNIIQAFSAINGKINNILAQENIEKELINFKIK